MDSIDLERLGLNKNEARVYYALLIRREATAQELVKALGVYRNIVYDNLEKLAEKGLVSVFIDGTKRKFVVAQPSAVIEFLENKQQEVMNEVSNAKALVPQISDLLGTHASKQEVSLFRGIAGLKKVLSDMVVAKESWSIGITNESVDILGETYWKNYNAKKVALKTPQWLLWNSDFKNTVISKNPRSHHRVLPKQLDQVTETIMFNSKVALMVYSAEPIVIVIENAHVFALFRKQFDFLWKLSKELPRKEK
jgi:HTH-type transcriptional regulator, sugar sensing transcriptional regulator